MSVKASWIKEWERWLSNGWYMTVRALLVKPFMKESAGRTFLWNDLEAAVYSIINHMNMFYHHDATYEKTDWSVDKLNQVDSIQENTDCSFYVKAIFHYWCEQISTWIYFLTVIILDVLQGEVKQWPCVTLVRKFLLSGWKNNFMHSNESFLCIHENLLNAELSLYVIDSWWCLIRWSYDSDSNIKWNESNGLLHQYLTHNINYTPCQL